MAGGEERQEERETGDMNREVGPPRALSTGSGETANFALEAAAGPRLDGLEATGVGIEAAVPMEVLVALSLPSSRKQSEVLPW